MPVIFPNSAVSPHISSAILLLDSASESVSLSWVIYEAPHFPLQRNSSAKSEHLCKRLQHLKLATRLDELLSGKISFQPVPQISHYLCIHHDHGTQIFQGGVVFYIFLVN